MEKNKELTEYLNGIYQNTRTAIQAIEDILPKVRDSSLKEELEKEKDDYLAIMQQCEMFANNNEISGIKDNNWLEKTRLSTSINMSTMINKTSRHISQLVLIGTFMGILTCIKDSFDHKNTSSELDKILSDLKLLEEKNIRSLINFLI